MDTTNSSQQLVPNSTTITVMSFVTILYKTIL